jgi:hypothetical protein
MAAESARLAIAAVCAAFIFSLLFAGPALALDTAVLDFSPLVGMKPLEGVPMGGMFANERINVYIDGAPAGSIVLADGAITEAGHAALPDPTMNFRMSAATAADIAAGKKSLSQCFLDGSITYEGVGPLNAIKAFFAGIGVWLYSLFAHPAA